jgi:hypothetical protein
MRFHHVLVVGDAPAGFGADGNTGAGTEAETSRPFPHAAGTGLNADLVKPCVARLGQRFAKIQRPRVAALPVAELEASDGHRAGALEFVVHVHYALLHGREAGGHFEN